MTKAGIYTVNATSQTVNAGSTINLGNVVRRYGCNCSLSASGVVVDGQGYYDISASITVSTSSSGTVTVTAYKNGTAITGATASQEFTETTGGTATLPVEAMIKQGCPCCEGDATITFVLSGMSATITNIAAKVMTV